MFVLSALHPSEWPRAISNIAQVWKRFSLTLVSTSLDDSASPSRYLNRVDSCSCVTMADTTSPSCASEPVACSTTTFTSAAITPAYISSNSVRSGVLPTPFLLLLYDNSYLVLLFHRPCACAVDELALLFTGSPAPPTPQEALESEMTEVDEGNGDGGEEECEVLAKDDLPAPSHIPSSLDPSLTPPGDPSAHPVHPSLRDPNALGLPHPLFTIKQLGVDRRLLVNRKRQLKMYRIWMQGKFQRIETDALPLVKEPDRSPP